MIDSSNLSNPVQKENQTSTNKSFINSTVFKVAMSALTGYVASYSEKNPLSELGSALVGILCLSVLTHLVPKNTKMKSCAAPRKLDSGIRNKIALKFFSKTGEKSWRNV